MALLVEDGTGVVGAESYQTVAAADTYHSNLGNSAWAALSTPVKEQSLRKATNYMTQEFQSRWKGYRIDADQALDFPRSSVIVFDSFIASNIVPEPVKNACAELALKANSGALNPDSTQNVKAKTIGPIKIEYDQYSSQNKRYDSIEQMLAPYLTGSSGITVALVK